MTFSRYLILGIAVAALGTYAQSAEAAYSCSNSTYTQGSTYGPSYGACRGSANSNATTITATAVLATAATQTASIISGRVANVMSGPGAGSFNVAQNGFSASTGKAAGEMGDGIGVWVNGSWTGAEDENTATAFDGDVFTGLVGVDYQVDDMVLVGVAAGYETMDFDTSYNGYNGVDGSLESDGWTVAPYVAVDLGGARANLTVGYTSVDYDTVRYDPGNGDRITGSPDADRYFISAGVGGAHELAERVRLRSDATVMYAREERDSYVEHQTGGTTQNISHNSDDSHLGKVAVDFRLGYMFEGVEPYALVGVDYDFAKSGTPLAAGQTESGTEDDFGAKFGAGVALNLGSNVTGGVEAYTSEFREDYNEYNATATLRVKF